MDAVLEDLDVSDMQSLSSFIINEQLPSCDYKTKNVAEVSLLTYVPVINNATKWFMNWLNAKAKGTILDFTSSKTKEHYPRQLQSLKHMRKTYFPSLVFDHCKVFRGTITELPSILQGSGDQAVVIMWRKADAKKAPLRCCSGNIELSRF